MTEQWKDGLPIIGEECLVDHTGAAIFKICMPLGNHSSGGIVYEILEGAFSGEVGVGVEDQFRPLKTPDEIEKERVVEVAKEVCYPSTATEDIMFGINHAIESLYNAKLLHGKEMKPLSKAEFLSYMDDCTYNCATFGSSLNANKLYENLLMHIIGVKD